MSAPSIISTFAFDAIGTRWEIETNEPLNPDIRGRIEERIRAFDRAYSRFRSDSLVSAMAAAPDGGRFEFPDDAAAMFDLYDRLFAATAGAVDPLVGSSLELLGYDAAYTLTPVPPAVRAHHVRHRPTWSADVRREGTTLITRRPVVLDLGAVGKGYLVDIITAILRDAGLTDFLVDAGGDLRHAGGEGVGIGLEHPNNPALVIGAAHLRNGALCASAGNRRAWGDGLHHVVDARTGVPAAQVAATWVLAEDAALADGLATALFFTSAPRLAAIFAFEYVLMAADGRATRSSDFEGELFALSN